jgi:hypothetical protein
MEKKNQINFYDIAIGVKAKETKKCHHRDDVS